MAVVDGNRWIAIECPLGHSSVATLQDLSRATSAYVRCPGILNQPGRHQCVIEIEVAAIRRRIERGEREWVIRADEVKGLQMQLTPQAARQV